MDGGSCNFDAAFQDGTVDFQSVIALTAESGDEGRMDIDHPVIIFFYEFFSQNGQETCQDYQVNAVLAQEFADGLIKLL